MTLDDLKSAAERMIELGGRATPGDWAPVRNVVYQCGGLMPYVAQTLPDMTHFPSTEDERRANGNADFIAASRTDAVTLARGVLALLEAIDLEMPSALREQIFERAGMTIEAGSTPSGRDLLHTLKLILPLARGYAAEHPVGSNARYVERAAAILEERR